MIDSALGLNIITVGGDEAELKRTELLIQFLKLSSGQNFSTLDEMNAKVISETASNGGSTLIRLFGKASIQALTWLGAKGRASTDVAILGYADAILLEPGQPARAVSVLPQALISAIASHKLSYDTGAAAFLIGVVDEAKIMAASIARIGFKRLLIVDTDDRRSEQLAGYLRRRLFGIEIEVVSRRTLTQVPNTSSMAINMTGINDRSMLEDIAYLNFLKKNGVWIDWTAATIQLGYDVEIKDAGAQRFDANQIRAWREVLLLGLLKAPSDQSGQRPEDHQQLIFDSWKKLTEKDPP